MDPLRLALTDPDTLDHRAARRSLDAAGRAYRIGYASKRPAAVVSAFAEHVRSVLPTL
jgi:hypothetical protein